MGQVFIELWDTEEHVDPTYNTLLIALCIQRMNSVDPIYRQYSNRSKV